MTPGPTPPAAQVLHLDLVLLSADVTKEARETLYEDVRALASLEGFLAAGVIEGSEGSDFDLAFFFVLDSPANLESFGTDARYVRFLQGGLARAMRSFGGADVQLAAAFEGTNAYAACAALAAPAQTYDWQVREALEHWGSGSRLSLCGLATGERQRYRGVGIMFSPQPLSRPSTGFEGFGVDFTAGPCRLLA